MSQSPFQRFLRELRRRNVPRAATIYVIAAWAAMEFSDVVVPNLNGPQWIVTAVIVAALAGFPVALVVAWVFEWGPEGVHRTEREPDPGVGEEPAAASASQTGPPSQASRPAQPSQASPSRSARASQPWLPVLAVLVVGIGSALAVAYVLRGDDGGGTAPVAADSAGDREPAMRPAPPPLPGGDEGLSPGFVDSIQREVARQLGGLDTIDFSGLMGVAAQAMARTGVQIMVSEPEGWRGNEDAIEAVPLTEGDTLRVRGIAYDTAGVMEVRVDGRTVVAHQEGQPRAPFTAALIGTAGAGIRTVAIELRTVDGRTALREYTIAQLPGGTP